MSVLKVTEVQSEDVAENVEVVAGQVRMTSDKEFTVLVVNAAHNSMLSRLAKSPEEKFVTLILNRPEDFGSDRVFILNENEGLSTAKKIAVMFPILLDAELTYKEAK